MERIDTTCGYREIDSGIVHYFGSLTDDGWCYKDMDAWKSGNGVIYISEFQYVDENDLWTRDSWLKELMSYHGKDSYPMEFFEYYAEYILKECTWEDLCAYMCDIEGYINYDYEDWKSRPINAKYVEEWEKAHSK